MKKVLLIKPHLETDAVWDPIRNCSNLGLWALASKLKEQDHEVKYYDEIFRKGGFNKKELFIREIHTDGSMQEYPCGVKYSEFEECKLNDFKKLSSNEFIKRHSAFTEYGTIKRIIVRTGNPIEKTLED